MVKLSPDERSIVVRFHSGAKEINMITKNKGTIAEAKVKADLLVKGYGIAVPEGDYLPFDLICITPDFNMYKIQVKGYKMDRDGKIPLLLKRNKYKPDRKQGIRARTYTKEEVDVFALYVPHLDECFYISSDILDIRKHALAFRVEKTKKTNQWGTRLLKDYKDFPLP